MWTFKGGIEKVSGLCKLLESFRQVQTVGDIFENNWFDWVFLLKEMLR